MLDIRQIKEQYPDHLKIYERALLREYLQYKILEGIFESRQADKLAFLGGTALRIVHGNNRFSEDIDLDNFDLAWGDFEGTIQKVKRFLELEGFEVEIDNVSKGAYRCYLKFPRLLYEQGLSPFQEEKILIQVDTVAQEYGYTPEIRILNKFDVFTGVRVTPLDVLLSKKIFTAINRKRAKGRDFYDITFLLSRTKPDFGFLSQKMGVETAEELRDELLFRVRDYDFEDLAEDVAPFLIDKDDVKRVSMFKKFWRQVDLTSE